MDTYKFIKEDTGKWYIDLPDYTGHKADLEMVEGADTMLDYVSEQNDEVSLFLSETMFDGACPLKLIHDHSQQSGGVGM